MEKAKSKSFTRDELVEKVSTLGSKFISLIKIKYEFSDEEVHKLADVYALLSAMTFDI